MVFRVPQRECSCVVCFTVEKEECDIPMDRYEWNMPKHLSSKQIVVETTRQVPPLPTPSSNVEAVKPPTPSPIRNMFVRGQKLANQLEKNTDLPKNRTLRSTFGECCKCLPCCRR